MGGVGSNYLDLTGNHSGLLRVLGHLLELMPKLVFRSKAHPWVALDTNNQFDKERTHQY